MSDHSGPRILDVWQYIEPRFGGVGPAASALANSVQSASDWTFRKIAFCRPDEIRFKSAFTAVLLIKLLFSADPRRTIPERLNDLTAAALLGHMVNYAVTVNSIRYRKPVDPYEQISFKKVAGVTSMRQYLTQTIVSHLREIGNLLLVLLAFAFDRRIAIAGAIILGASHWIFALRRVVVISKRLRKS